MSGYTAVRDWVDRCWAGNWRLLNVPVILPGLPVVLLGGVGVWLWLAWAAVWLSFILWRWSIHLRAAAALSDQKYDRSGKYKLSPEYWSTESATAAARRKKKHG